MVSDFWLRGYWGVSVEVGVWRSSFVGRLVVMFGVRSSRLLRVVCSHCVWGGGGGLCPKTASALRLGVLRITGSGFTGFCLCVCLGRAGLQIAVCPNENTLYSITGSAWDLGLYIACSPTLRWHCWHWCCELMVRHSIDCPGLIR